jgi:hypothetical protein
LRIADCGLKNIIQNGDRGGQRGMESLIKEANEILAITEASINTAKKHK